MLHVDIKKKVGGFSLDVCFQTEEETMALLGASGCGKSMTLKCIAGIMKPDSGKIVLNGRVLYDSEKGINLPPQKRRVGYLFQQYALFPNMTVEQNIAVGCRERDKAAKKAAVTEKIRTFHLEGMEKKYPGQLSGGQQQRVALARILINQPELLLLDEPFSALDDYLKWQLEMTLSDLLKEYGKGVIFVSHNRDEVYRLCGSVCVLWHGKSQKKQPVLALFDQPGTLAAAEISGCKNFSRARPVKGTDTDSLIEALDWGVTLRCTCPVPENIRYVGARAHYVRLCQEQKENSFPCEIERVIEDVFSVIVMLKTPGGSQGRSLLRVELQKGEWKAGKNGMRSGVFAMIEPENLMLLTE